MKGLSLSLVDREPQISLEQEEIEQDQPSKGYEYLYRHTNGKTP